MHRILFLSGTTTGGSGRSQRELANEVARRGHEVLFLVDDKRPARASRWLYEGLSDVSVRLAGRPLAKPVSRWRDSIQRRTTATELGGLAHLTTAYPQNSLPQVLKRFNPTVVVVNSVERWAWRRVHAICQDSGVPTLLYVREEASLPHLDTGSLPTVLLANTPSLAERLRISGLDCLFLPSVVDVEVTRTDSTRKTALAINPIEIKGGDFVWEVAVRSPDIPFILQEAWKLKSQEIAEIHTKRIQFPNATFRVRQEPGPELYGDARVLLVPYRVDSRPRVILEAQSNGIPVIAADVPALREAVGPGGVVIPLDADAWADAVARMWSDQAWYAELSSAAVAHSQRPEVDAAAIAQQFVDVLDRVRDASSALPRSAGGKG